MDFTRQHGNLDAEINMKTTDHFAQLTVTLKAQPVPASTSPIAVRPREASLELGPSDPQLIHRFTTEQSNPSVTHGNRTVTLR